MSWKYYRNGKLVKKCDDIPETMEDAVIELQENGHNVSDCIVEVDDNWSPDYPPEEAEYQDTFKPMAEKYIVGSDIDKLKKLLKALPKIKAPHDFNGKLFKRIIDDSLIKKTAEEHQMFKTKYLPQLSRYIRFKYWCKRRYYKIRWYCKMKMRINKHKWYWKIFS
mgnify:CR=1 FL=1|tara:strand:+ start:73 stop:567 length:495 start_codon:yes stop_codon:yes gene_type:complete